LTGGGDGLGQRVDVAEEALVVVGLGLGASGDGQAEGLTIGESVDVGKLDALDIVLPGDLHSVLLDELAARVIEALASGPILPIERVPLLHASTEHVVVVFDELVFVRPDFHETILVVVGPGLESC
jgi:hypothetical protein